MIYLPGLLWGGPAYTILNSAAGALHRLHFDLLSASDVSCGGFFMASNLETATGFV